MRSLASILPFVAFAWLGRPWASLATLLLQLTVLGWLPAAEWATRAVEDRRDVERLQYAMSQRRQHKLR